MLLTHPPTDRVASRSVVTRGMSALALVGWLALSACGDAPSPEWDREVEPPEGLSGLPSPAKPLALLAPSLDAESATVNERVKTLGKFLDRHWRVPVPLQGEPPDGFSEAEASLDPAVCGACHPAQWTAWQSSLHAAAFSPGFYGQLIEGGLSHPAEVRQCQTCHAPLAEQQAHDASLAASPHFDAELRAQGIVCAACHVRGHRTFGPPRRADLPPLASPLPHGGFEVRIEYTESRFCAACHQFFDDPGVNGKPIENTYAEWQASPQAAEGRSCQSCHMPDRAHLWRGIHDPEMVRAAVDMDLVVLESDPERVRAALVVVNRDVGHAFPTYVTPRVFLAVWQVRRDGSEVDDSRVEATIGREVDFSSSPWREVFDTRVLPGESVKLDYALPRAPDAAALIGRVTVAPDHHYRGLFEGLLPSLEGQQPRELIAEALRRTSRASFVLGEIRRSLLGNPVP